MQDKSILIRNVYHMLAYAFTELRRSEYKAVGTEKFENVHDLFASILAKGMSRQLKQGLHREYVTFTDDIPALRGKVDMPGTLKNRMNRRATIVCKFDELSENVPCNQVIKAALLLLLREDRTSDANKTAIKKLLPFLSEIEEITPYSIRWDRLGTARVSPAYRLMLNLIRLLFDGMLMTEEDGTVHLASFIDEQRMCRLYEKFILEYFRQEHEEIGAASSQIPWALDDSFDDYLPIMQTDITLTGKNRTLIIDAKYYAKVLGGQYGGSTLHSGNLYQVFTYVKNKEAQIGASGHKVAGLLLYARTDEDSQPSATYQMSGNEIGVDTLDLNQDFSVISGKPDSIAAAFAATGSSAI